MSYSCLSIHVLVYELYFSNNKVSSTLFVSRAFSHGTEKVHVRQEASQSSVQSLVDLVVNESRQTAQTWQRVLWCDISIFSVPNTWKFLCMVIYATKCWCYSGLINFIVGNVFKTTRNKQQQAKITSAHTGKCKIGLE